MPISKKTIKNRRLKQRQRRQQREPQKSTDWQNKTFARSPRFFVHSSPPLHDFNVKVPNFTFCGGHESKTTFVFFSWTPILSFKIQLQKNLTRFDELTKDGISAIKFEAMRIHFLRDVFKAVSVIVVWAPLGENG